MTERDDPLASLGPIEPLLARLGEATDPRARADAQALTRALLDFHRASLARILVLLPSLPSGDGAVAALAADDAVAALLLLHGLHPDPLEVRARAALGGACPSGWRVERVEVEGEHVRVHLGRSGDPRRAAASERVRSWVTEGLGKAAPDVESIEIVGDDEPGFLLPAERLVARRPIAGRTP